MKPAPLKIIYTVFAEDVPIVALEATGNEARELLKERWFLIELSALQFDGEPIYQSETRLRVRPSTEDEWATYEKEFAASEDADELLSVYLIDIDRD